MKTVENPATALVTGANRGLGLALARRLISQYQTYTVLGVRDPDTAGAAREITDKFPDLAVVARIDYTAPSQFQLPEAPRQIELLINCGGANFAGGYAPSAAKGPLAELRAEALSELFMVNAVGPIMLCQELLPRLSRPSLVANISTIRASISSTVDAGSIGYATTKAALNMATRKLAAQLGPLGISVVAVDPGWIRTRMGGDEAPRSAEEAAELVLDTLLSSPESLNGRFIDGNGKDEPW